jgi:hypothetical protein
MKTKTMLYHAPESEAAATMVVFVRSLFEAERAIAHHFKVESLAALPPGYIEMRNRIDTAMQEHARTRVAEGWEALSEGVFKSVNKRGDGFEVYQYYDWDTCEYYYSVSFEAMGECVLRKRFETFTEAADAAERLYKFLKEEGYCGLQ